MSVGVRDLIDAGAYLPPRCTVNARSLHARYEVSNPVWKDVLLGEVAALAENAPTRWFGHD